MNPNDRLDALATVRTAMPDVDNDTALRITEWALTGTTLLDPSRVDTAAEALAAALGKRLDAETYDRMRGIAQRVITAYATPKN